MATPLLINVDDDLASRYAITRVLRHAGYEVLEATCGEHAIELSRTRRPDLLLLDVNLPDCSGLEVTHRIKTDPETADILVLQHSASFVRPSDRVRGLEKGADGYLTVPIEPEVLLATVRSLLRIRQAEAAVRESARQWRATFDAIGDAVALLDADLRIVRCNRSLASRLGRAPGDLIGMRWPELLPGLPDGLPHDATNGRIVELELEHEGGWVRVVADPVPAVNGGPAGIVAVLSDIDARKRAESDRQVLFEREREARAQAEGASRAKDDFLAVLSHELRTPLNAVMGWARIIGTQAIAPERVPHAAETILRNAKAQSQLIDDLLDVSRAISGHLHLEAAPVNLGVVARSAMEVVQLAADARGVSLAMTGRDEPLRVIGDERRLRQVVWNLLSNAIKFTPRGGRVDVAAAREEQTAVVRVRDTGIGIDQAALPHVFDRFWQAEQETGRPAGLGLGLAIVRHLTESHGGSVEARSDGNGMGATFFIRIPLMGDDPAH